MGDARTVTFHISKGDETVVKVDNGNEEERCVDTAAALLAVRGVHCAAPRLIVKGAMLGAAATLGSLPVPCKVLVHPADAAGHSRTLASAKTTSSYAPHLPEAVRKYYIQGTVFCRRFAFFLQDLLMTMFRTPEKAKRA